MARYLLETKAIKRIRLVIHPDNAASRRLAEKCHFRHEGTARGAWYNTVISLPKRCRSAQNDAAYIVSLN
jgi:RimJ/RimL family protein N-acetyltransferase